MFGAMNLDLVKSHHDDLRREADNRRLVAKANTQRESKRPAQTRRVFGLRLSLAS